LGGGPADEVRYVDLDRVLDYVGQADVVILLHNDPVERLLAFLGCSKSVAAAPVLVWGAPQDSELVVEYLLSGAKACFLEGAEPRSLFDAFPVVRGGRHYLPPVVQRMLLSGFVEISDQAVAGRFGPYHDPDGLTEREREVLALLADGYTNPEIAARLFLEVGTVKNHVHHILHKLDVPDRQATARDYRTRQRFTASSAGAR